MGSSHLTWNVQLCHVAALVTCLLCIVLPFTSAYSSPESEVPAFDDFSKRDVGLEMQCQSHPRNCPGGIIFKRPGGLQSWLRTRELDTLSDEGRLRAQAILEAGEDLKRSLHTLRNGLRYKLIDLLKPAAAVYGADDENEGW